MSSGRHALVMGASGITGWAIVNQILRGYPKKGIFSNVTAVTNRPLRHEDTLWPKSDALQICSGLDLLKGSQAELGTAFRSKVRNIENVTDLYFFGEPGLLPWHPR
jgi:nucleoside-diphosphate-sugar epimerase